MENINSVDLKEVWAIFCSSSGKLKRLILLIIASMLLTAVLMFGVYALVIWLLMLVLLVSYENILFHLIIINYHFLKPQLVTTNYNISSVNETLNNHILWQMRVRYPNIVFQVSSDNKIGGMQAYNLDGVSYIDMDKFMLQIHTQQEFAAIIYHELGHISLKHNDESKLVFTLGYLVFIFLPIVLPLFWLIGSYVIRCHEFTANEFSLKNDPNRYMIKTLEIAEQTKKEISFWKSLWHNLLFMTVAPAPSLKSQIKMLKKLQHYE
jgi:hypothetical protein